MALIKPAEEETERLVGLNVLCVLFKALFNHVTWITGVINRCWQQTKVQEQIFQKVSLINIYKLMHLEKNIGNFEANVLEY